MVLELLAHPIQENYLSSDQKEQDFAHHNLKQTEIFTIMENVTSNPSIIISTLTLNYKSSVCQYYV